MICPEKDVPKRPIRSDTLAVRERRDFDEHRKECPDGVSRSPFPAGFGCAIGATLHAYIVLRRARFSRRLLAEGEELGLTNVDAGFVDQSHLARAIVRKLGITPARYQQAVRRSKNKAISFNTAHPRR